MPNANTAISGISRHFADEVGGDCPLNACTAPGARGQSRGRVYSAAVARDRIWRRHFGHVSHSCRRRRHRHRRAASRTISRRPAIASSASPRAVKCCRSCARRRPDLVILDLMLPGMDGLIVCQAMRADPAIASHPDHHADGARRGSRSVSGLELGADDYVTKPFSPKELVARVDCAAQTRRPHRRRAAAAALRPHHHRRRSPHRRRSTARTCG